MNRDICKFINSIAYSGLIQHGSLNIKSATLSYKNENKAPLPWIQEVKAPVRSVIFVNIDNLLSTTMQHDISAMRSKNFYEAAIIKGLVLSFLDSGISPKEMAIVSPVQSHLYMIQRQLRSKAIK